MTKNKPTNEVNDMRKTTIAISSFLLGAAMMTVSSAYGAIGDKAEAVFAKFNFVVDGKSVTPSETPLVYNGTTYLPVRSLANIVGMDVTYKIDSRTIVLNSVTNNTYGSNELPKEPNTTSDVVTFPNYPNYRYVKSERVLYIDEVAYVDVAKYAAEKKLYPFHYTQENTIKFLGDEIVVSYTKEDLVLFQYNTYIKKDVLESQLTR